MDNNSLSSSLKNATVSEEPEKSDAQEVPVTFNDAVRILVSYDMGSNTSGRGRMTVQMDLEQSLVI
jgi:hypothetical protein